VAEKDTYRELSEKMVRVFGAEVFRSQSAERSEITAMVSRLADQIGLENVTELSLVGIREILDGECDPIIHVSSL